MPEKITFFPNQKRKMVLAHVDAKLAERMARKPKWQPRANTKR